MMARHRLAKCKLVLSAALAESEFRVSVTVRSRSGNTRCFWDLWTVYDIMKLDQYDYASNWAMNNFKTWDKYHMELFGLADGSGVIININHADNDKCSKNALSWEKRCFNFNGMSSQLLIQSLFRCASQSTQKGGFKKQVHKEAARDLLTPFTKLLNLKNVAYDFIMSDTDNSPI